MKKTLAAIWWTCVPELISALRPPMISTISSCSGTTPCTASPPNATTAERVMGVTSSCSWGAAAWLSQRCKGAAIVQKSAETALIPTAYSRYSGLRTPNRLIGGVVAPGGRWPCCFARL